MGALLALLLPLIPGLIQGVQTLFVKAPTPATAAPAPDINQTKADAVLQALQAIIAHLKAVNAPLPDGSLPANIPVTDDALRASIETLYQQMKAADQLTPAPPTGSLWLVQGSVQALKVSSI